MIIKEAQTDDLAILLQEQRELQAQGELPPPANSELLRGNLQGRTISFPCELQNLVASHLSDDDYLNIWEQANGNFERIPAFLQQRVLYAANTFLSRAHTSLENLSQLVLERIDLLSFRDSL